MYFQAPLDELVYHLWQLAKESVEHLAVVAIRKLVLHGIDACAQGQFSNKLLGPDFSLFDHPQRSTDRNSVARKLLLLLGLLRELVNPKELGSEGPLLRKVRRQLLKRSVKDLGNFLQNVGVARISFPRQHKQPPDSLHS